MKKIQFLFLILFILNSDLCSQSWFIQYEDQSQRPLFSSSVVNNKVAWVGGAGGIVLKTVDGLNWQDVSSAILEGDLYCIEAISENVAFVGSYLPPNKIFIYKTENGGTNWDTVKYAETDGAFINIIHFFNEKDGIAISDPQTGLSFNSFISLASSDSGNNWSVNENAYCQNGEISYSNSASFIDSLGWFGTSNGRIFKSTDRGTSWQPFEAPIYFGQVQSLAYISDNVGLAFIISQGSGYWTLMIDGISNWKVVNPPGITWLGVPVAAIPALNQFWVCGSFTEQRANSIFTSPDTGGTFIEQDVETILPDSWFSHLQLALYNQSIYGVAITNKGQILGYHDLVVSVHNSVQNKIGFNLHQNYPNPFNPGTVIGYQLPVSGDVTLKVFDVLGREVATLVDEFRDAGYHEVEFQLAVGGRQYASGIYFYQLRVGEFIETKKMILLR